MKSVEDYYRLDHPDLPSNSAEEDFSLLKKAISNVAFTTIIDALDQIEELSDD